jgi:hypothetical protein
MQFIKIKSPIAPITASIIADEMTHEPLWAVKKAKIPDSTDPKIKDKIIFGIKRISNFFQNFLGLNGYCF